MKKMRKQFVRLLNIYGVSSDEGRVRSYLIPCLKSTMDSVHVDEYGNLLAEKKVGTGEGATIMLSAHMDTVKNVEPDRKLLIEGDFIMSDYGALGADDRAGIAIILEILRVVNSGKTRFNGTLKVAFSREEEIGCVGANQIDYDFYEDVDLAIVVDRKGRRDIVTGCGTAFCSNEVGYFLENVGKLSAQEGWKCVEGGVSDAMTFSMGGINSVNLSAGYQNEHTSNEYVNMSAMEDTAKFILQGLDVVNDFYETFTAVPSYNKWVQSYYKGTSAYGSYSWAEDDYYGVPSYEEMFELMYESNDGLFQVYDVGNGEVLFVKGKTELYLTYDEMIHMLEMLQPQEEVEALIDMVDTEQ